MVPAMVCQRRDGGVIRSAVAMARAISRARGLEDGCASGFRAALARSKDAIKTFRRSLRVKLKPRSEPSPKVRLTAPAPLAFSISLTCLLRELKPFIFVLL